MKTLEIDSETEKYDAWNERKKAIEFSNAPRFYFPHAGEVWMSSFGKNVGFEQDGAGNNFVRPVLIVKEFNHRMFWGTPLSTKQKRYDFYHNMTDPYGRPISVILAQLRLISEKRLQRKLYDFPDDALLEIRTKLRCFLS